MAEYPERLPHGDLQEVFPDVFFVTGTSKPDFGGVRWQYSRNMTVLRQGKSLVLVNTVRLSDAGLQRLDSLGNVEHVVKLGSFHGMDDAFYLDRYGAKQWAMEGMTHEGGQDTDFVLGAAPFPIEGCSFFSFDTSKLPEGLLLLEREGGILVSCDSLQNWQSTDEFFSDQSKQMMTEIGFIKPANVGPGWVNHCCPEATDFEAVKALSFRHLMPAHGTVLKDSAKEQLVKTFAAQFGV